MPSLKVHAQLCSPRTRTQTTSGYEPAVLTSSTSVPLYPPSWWPQILFRRERVAFKPIFVRCVHHLVEIMLQPFFVVSQLGVTAFQVPKFADFVGRLRLCRQLQIFGSFCAILLGAEHMISPPVSWPLCDGYLLMSPCKGCVQLASVPQNI